MPSECLEQKGVAFACPVKDNTKLKYVVAYNFIRGKQVSTTNISLGNSSPNVSDYAYELVKLLIAEKVYQLEDKKLVSQYETILSEIDKYLSSIFEFEIEAAFSDVMAGKKDFVKEGSLIIDDINKIGNLYE